jgi:hypothetical protein
MCREGRSPGALGRFDITQLVVSVPRGTLNPFSVFLMMCGAIESILVVAKSCDFSSTKWARATRQEFGQKMPVPSSGGLPKHITRTTNGSVWRTGPQCHDTHSSS